MPVTLRPGLQILYMRILSSGAMEFMAFMMDHQPFLETSNQETMIIWTLLGRLVMVILYNLFVFSITRDMVYLHLVCYAATFFMAYYLHFGCGR